MHKKVIISDLDGTLLNSKSNISEYSKKVILQLIDNNIRFYVATGRAYPDVKQIVDSIGIKIPVITANGAVINDEQGNEIHRNDLAKEISDVVLDIDYASISDSIHMNIYSNNRWIVETDEIKVNPFEEKPDQYTYEVKSREEISKIKITKFFYIGYHKDLLKLEKEILDRLEGKVNIAFTHPECLEVFDIEVTKANAIKTLSTIENFNIKDVVAFGDGFNDYEMLKSVGKGYVMGNAHYKLKDVLPNYEVIDSNDNDGVAKKIVDIFSLEI